MATQKSVIITVDLTEERAAALAQFIKRLMLSDCEASPSELRDAEHQRMQSALFDVGVALAEAGFNPR